MVFGQGTLEARSRRGLKVVWQGADLAQLLAACPEAKDQLRNVLLSDFLPDHTKLAKVCHRSFGNGRVSWMSPLVAGSGGTYGWNVEDVFRDPEKDLVDDRVRRGQVMNHLTDDRETNVPTVLMVSLPVLETRNV